MTSLAFPLPRLSSRRLALPPLAVVLGAALLIAMVNPVGYRGAGADDWHYLQAARCAVAAHAPCLPTNHWGARFPLVLPMAATLGLLGDGRAPLILLALVYGLAAIGLFVALVERQFGRDAALIAGLAFTTTPTVAQDLVQINIETPELLYAFAALLCLQQATRSGRSRWAVLGGMALGLAVISRTTALLLLPVGVIIAVFVPSLRRVALPTAIGLGIVLGAEALLYTLACGDPSRGWRLEFGHAQLPSSEIATPLPPGESPLFNPRLIANWRRPMGIHVQWTVDALLNLLANPAIGFVLIAATGLLWVERRAASRELWLLAGAAALDAAGLIYGLAIDPKPRMFELAVAAAATIIGVLLAPRWKGVRAILIGAFLALAGLLAAAMIDDSYRLQPVDPVISAWAAEGPGPTLTDPATASMFTFLAPVRALRLAPSPAGTRLLRLSGADCVDAPRGWTLVRRWDVPAKDGPIVAALRARRLLFAPLEPLTLCLSVRG